MGDFPPNATLSALEVNESMSYYESLQVSYVSFVPIYHFLAWAYMVLGLVGNSLSLITLFRSPALQTSHFLFYKIVASAELIYCSNFFACRLVERVYSRPDQDDRYFSSWPAAVYHGIFARFIYSSTSYTVLYMTILLTLDRFAALWLSQCYHQKRARDKATKIVVVVCIFLAGCFNSWAAIVNPSVTSKSTRQASSSAAPERPISTTMSTKVTTIHHMSAHFSHATTGNSDQTTPASETNIDHVLDELSDDTEGYLANLDAQATEMFSVQPTSFPTTASMIDLNTTIGLTASVTTPPVSTSSPTVTHEMYRLVERMSPNSFLVAQRVKNFYNMGIRLAYPIILLALTVMVIWGFIRFRGRHKRLQNSNAQGLAGNSDRGVSRKQERNARRARNKQRHLYYLMGTVVVLSLIQVIPNEMKRFLGIRYPHPYLLSQLNSLKWLQLSEAYKLLWIYNARKWLIIISNLATQQERSIKFFLFLLFNSHFRTQFWVMISSCFGFKPKASVTGTPIHEYSKIDGVAAAAGAATTSGSIYQKRSSVGAGGFARKPDSYKIAAKDITNGRQMRHFVPQPTDSDSEDDATATCDEISHSTTAGRKSKFLSSALRHYHTQFSIIHVSGCSRAEKRRLSEPLVVTPKVETKYAHRCSIVCQNNSRNKIITHFKKSSTANRFTPIVDPSKISLKTRLSNESHPCSMHGIKREGDKTELNYLHINRKLFAATGKKSSYSEADLSHFSNNLTSNMLKTGKKRDVVHTKSYLGRYGCKGQINIIPALINIIPAEFTDIKLEPILSKNDASSTSSLLTSSSESEVLVLKKKKSKSMRERNAPRKQSVFKMLSVFGGHQRNDKSRHPANRAPTFVQGLKSNFQKHEVRNKVGVVSDNCNSDQPKIGNPCYFREKSNCEKNFSSNNFCEKSNCEQNSSSNNISNPAVSDGPMVVVSNGYTFRHSIASREYFIDNLDGMAV